MSERWAAIVYGRTYHRDFRFISVPQDFTPADLHWASQYIVATTQQARNLADSPRWSLFKNTRFCVVGVTAAVKDLIGTTVKDDRGRPLYIFVGYVTHISSSQIEPPAFSSSLDDFKPLYREIEPVWLAKNYDSQSRQPAASQYTPLTFSHSPATVDSQYAPDLNRNSTYPQKIYLWPNFAHQNQLLWQAASQCAEPTSICLNIKGKILVNSPFLNLSGDRTEKFQILDRLAPSHRAEPSSKITDSESVAPSLSQKISARARNDIDLTLQQAAKMAIASQELMNNLGDSEGVDAADELNTSNEPEFGFKKKLSHRDRTRTQSQQHDWF